MNKAMVKFGTLAAFLLVTTLSFAQCEADKFTSKCLEKVSAQGYTFLKSYKIDGEGGSKDKIEYPYIFSKGGNYMVAIANKDAEIKGVVLNLYDSNRKLVGTNFDGKKYFSSIGYTCTTTGIYYLSFSFEGSKDYCAASVLGFKK